MINFSDNDIEVQLLVKWLEEGGQLLSLEHRERADSY